MDDNLPEVEAERHLDILGAVKTQALAKPLAVTLAEGRDETFDKTNSYTVEEEAPTYLATDRKCAAQDTGRYASRHFIRDGR